MTNESTKLRPLTEDEELLAQEGSNRIYLTDRKLMVYEGEQPMPENLLKVWLKQYRIHYLD